METRIELITPDMAREYLSVNKNNRSLRSDKVDTFARDMENGRWELSHQGIAFAESGELIDGQHRLHAILRANVPVQMMVTRGIPAASMQIIDRGDSRTVHDVLTIQYQKNGDDFTAMMRNIKMSSVISQLARCSISQHFKPSVNEIVNLFNEFADESTFVYNEIVKGGDKQSSEICAAAIAALRCGVSRDALHKFFRVFQKYDVRDCDGYNAQAALNWRLCFDDAKAKGTVMHKRRQYIGTQNAIFHFIANDSTTRMSMVPNAPRYDVREIVENAIKAKEEE